MTQPPSRIPYAQTAPGAEHYGAPSPEGEGPQFSMFSPGELFHVLRRNWIVILLCLAMAGGVAWAYLKYTRPVYEAVTIIELSARRPRLMPVQGAVIEDQGSGQLDTILNTRLEKIKGLAMLSNAAQRVAATRPEFGHDLAGLAANIRNRTVFTLVRRTPLVRIEVQHNDPVLAALYCNAYGQAITEGAVDENRAASDSAVSWLEQQALNQREDLQKADDALLRFRKDTDLAALENRRRNAESAMAAFNASLVAVESDATRQADLVQALEHIELNPENAGKLPSSIPREAEIQEALTKWLAASADRTALLARYTTKHPEVQAKDRLIEQLKKQATEALNRARTTAVANLDLYRKQAASLRMRIDEQAKIANEMNLKLAEQTMKQTALERARDASDTAYRGVLNRIQEARLAADENTATVKILESAAEPRVPIRPNRRNTVVMAGGAGLLLGLLLALLKELLQNRVMGPLDVEALTGLRVLGIVPHVGRRNRKDLALACLTERNSQIVESFAGLRTVLDAGEGPDAHRVILITSSLPEEGKTTTCCNLAVTYARQGLRTVLIDFDLRRPRIAGIFSVAEDKQGLLAMLSDAASSVPFPSLVSPGPLPNLSLIATRPSSSSAPADVIGSRRVGDLIAWARANFDRVILDAPPLGLISDAIVLGAHADLVLVMTRPGVSRRRLVRHVARRFRDAAIDRVGAIVNDLDVSSRGYGYGYGSYHYYRYYHSHYAPDQKSPGPGPAGSAPAR